jgi:23S rRNA (cytidine1920-2'-O)/16S rRNA (cytidine1409-2'-O)-methyltransferase
MARKGGARLCALAALVAEGGFDVDAIGAIRAGLVLVDGRVVTNPASLVRRDASITVRTSNEKALRGEVKLGAALAVFGLSVGGRVALDLGAAAGGFTRALLRARAKRVYAVDAGFGQLLGSLRQHPAVVNLERTNLGDLNRSLVPETVEVVAIDLSYISLARSVPQLNGRVVVAPGADLVGLVKPQFELGLSAPPAHPRRLAEAIERASDGIERSGWTVMGVEESPLRGSRGSIEFLLHARRRWPSSASREPGRSA